MSIVLNKDVEVEIDLSASIDADLDITVNVSMDYGDEGDDTFSVLRMIHDAIDNGHQSDAQDFVDRLEEILQELRNTYDIKEVKPVETFLWVAEYNTGIAMAKRSEHNPFENVIANVYRVEDSGKIIG